MVVIIPPELYKITLKHNNIYHGFEILKCNAFNRSESFLKLNTPLFTPNGSYNKIQIYTRSKHN